MIDTKAYDIPEEKRTFETRVCFIRDIFSNLYPREDIMQKCVEYKLAKSYWMYAETLRQPVLNLTTGEDPLKVLKLMD